MKKLLLILLCFPMIGFGQFTDNFSDGDFIANPTWLGSVGVFEVDANNILHLNDSTTGIASLVTQSQAIINAEWIFDVRLDFSPSTSNYAKVYIASDMMDLSGPLNGVYVKIGGQSGSIDDISLYTQTGINSNEIIDGVAGLVSNNPDIRVKVTRDAIGNWELFLDTNGVFFTQGTALDNNITSSDYFGVYCKYTVTRSDKFWFDDFSVSGGAISQQKTYVPDDNFENYLETNGMGDGVALNDSVFTSAIDTVTHLDINGMFLSQQIANLTGIKEFISLIFLDVSNNNLIVLDVSLNTNLKYLYLSTQNVNQLILPNSNNLLELSFGFNYITAIDVSQYTNLILLDCAFNGIITLDVSNNYSLQSLISQDTPLTYLDLRNGNNQNMIDFLCFDNPNLTCINVDDAVWSTNNWTAANGNIDTQHYFSENCPPSTILEHSSNKELLKVTDLLGRETKQTNQPLFYIYDDGTVEKRIVIKQ